MFISQLVKQVKLLYFINNRLDRIQMHFTISRLTYQLQELRRISIYTRSNYTFKYFEFKIKFQEKYF